MADELDPKSPNQDQRRTGDDMGRSSEEDITGSDRDDEEEFEDLDEADEDEGDLES